MERTAAQRFVRQRKEEKADADGASKDKDDGGKKDRRGGRTHGAQGKGNNDRDGKQSGGVNPNACCFLHPDGNHYTRQCRSFLNMTTDERGKSVVANNACRFCLSAKAHIIQQGVPCPRESQWTGCQERGCGKYHSRLLHGCTVPGICSTAKFRITANVAKLNLPATYPLPSDSMMLVQAIPTANSTLITLWDSGATVSLVSSRAVRKLGVIGTPVSYELTVVKGSTSKEESYLHQIQIFDCCGRSHTITAFEMDEITGEVESININGVVHLFDNLHGKDVRRVRGDIELLVGMSNSELHPVRVNFVDHLSHYTSIFGTGHLLGGRHKLLDLKHLGSVATFAATVSRAKIGNIKPIDLDDATAFFRSEAFGIDVKPKCDSCKNCPECLHRVHDMSRTERNELELRVQNESGRREFPLECQLSLLG